MSKTSKSKAPKAQEGQDKKEGHGQSQSRMKKHFHEKVVSALAKQFKYDNVMQVPTHSKRSL